MKKILILSLAAALASCGGGSSDNGAMSTTGANSSASRMLTVATVAVNPDASLSDGELIGMAYQDGLAEIQLSQLALQKATNDKVKDFARRMITDHTAANTAISRFASQRQLTLPSDLSSEQSAALDRLSGLAGTDFDKAYMVLNVAAHETDLAKLLLHSQDIADPDLMALTDALYPVLKVHLVKAEDIDNLINPSAFVIHAYRDGLAEIKLAQLTLQKTSRDEVKAFAQRMIDDHSAMNDQLATIAGQKNIGLPNELSPEQQAEMDQLSRLSGADFDKSFMEMNVLAHVKGVAYFKRQSEQGLDPDIRAAAQQALPTLLLHLQRAVTLNNAIVSSTLYRLYQDSKAEVQISWLGLLHASNADVKFFAQRMISDHAAANTRMLTLAKGKNLALPNQISARQWVTFAYLLNQSDQDFDRTFMNFNRTAHQQDIDLLSGTDSLSADADIRTFEQDLLDTLKEHLALAEEIAQRLQTAR